MSSRLLRLAAATGAVVTPLIAFHGVASAHHTTVTCQSPGVWLIVNSETDKTMTFTTDQGHTGSIDANDDGAGPHGQTTVAYSGTHLEVDGVWSNGVINHNEGDGQCTDNTTTTTVAETTTTEASTTSSTTLPASTSTTTTTVPVSSTTAPSTSLPTTSSSVATTSTTSEPPSTPSPTTSTPSTPPSTSSTVPECSDNPNSPTDDCAPICQPVTQPDGTNSCGPSLPATGSDVLWLLPAAVLMMLCGGVIVICGRRR